MSVQVVDLFCGVGGLTRGLLDAGLDVIAGFDNDQICEYAYNKNNDVPFNCLNIRDMKGDEIVSSYQDDSCRVLVGCASCQPFFAMRFKLKKANRSDEKYDLLASKLGEIGLIRPTHDRGQVAVKDFILGLPEVKAGDVDPDDPMHRTAVLSEKNLERIQKSVHGGTWLDWLEELRCLCHRKERGKTYSSIYGRMTWEQIGPTNYYAVLFLWYRTVWASCAGSCVDSS